MLTYQQLDAIADSYIPILFVVTVFFLAAGIFKLGLKKYVNELSSLMISVLIVYIVMTLDNRFGIWPLFDLDYSTHTALSLVFVVYLSSNNTTMTMLSVVSFLLYALLMVYQQYHTIADIASTTAALVPIFWALFYRKILKFSR